MRTVIIDCSGLRDEAEFWEKYLTATKPEGAGNFGRNLNAFWDALDGDGPGHPGECTVRFVNTSAIRGWRQGEFYRHLQKIARDARFSRVHID